MHSLSVTDIEIGRQRRALAQIDHAARMGAALPVPEFRIGHRNTNISFGPIQISVWSEIGRDTIARKITVTVSDGGLERRLFELFPDKDVTKKLFDHIWRELEKYVDKEPNNRLDRNGDALFC